ncbi:MAG: hypothetical protein PVSMB7_30080 [Chloroflexota bacterium]
MIVYAVLFLMAVAALVHSTRSDQNGNTDIATWRNLSLAPMAMVVVGSFVSLPVLTIIVTAAKIWSF